MEANYHNEIKESILTEKTTLTEQIKENDGDNSTISDTVNQAVEENSELKHSDSLPDLIWSEPDDNEPKSTKLASSESCDTGFQSDSAESTPSPDIVKQIVTGGSVSDDKKDSESCEKDDSISDKDEEEEMDILGNGLLKKKILVPGKGRDTRPINGDTVTIKVNGVLDSGVHVDDDVFTFILNDGDVIIAFDLAVALMEEDEVCELSTEAIYAYGSLGRKPDIPKDAHITYKIHLSAIDNVRELSSYSTEDRLKRGENKRERGNFLYARQDYTGAINSYSKAVKMLDDTELNAILDETARAPISQSYVKCYNNMAACQLKIDAIDAAIRSCEKVVLVEKDNVKALFRLGKAYGAKNEVDKALTYLRKAIKLDPESKMIHQEVLNLNRRKSKESETEREMYQRMLGVKPGESPKKKEDTSSSVMKWVLMAGGVAAVMASIGLTYYRTS